MSALRCAYGRYGDRRTAKRRRSSHNPARTIQRSRGTTTPYKRVARRADRVAGDREVRGRRVAEHRVGGAHAKQLLIDDPDSTPDIEDRGSRYPLVPDQV